MIARIKHFLTAGVWELRLTDRRSVKTLSIKALRVVLLASLKFAADSCHKTASVLTYYSLLNIVPVLAVAFAIAKGFGLRKLIEKQIVQFAQQANLEAEVTSQVLMFSQNLLNQAKGGVIAGVGIVLLLWTVISILGRIEQSFNDIWEVKRSRTLVRKFGDYLAILVLAPVLLVVSSSATVLVTSKVQMILRMLPFAGVFNDAVLFLLNLLPYVSIWVLLTTLYLIMPNLRVPVRSAVVGGIVAGTIMQIVQWAYVKFQIGVASYGAIYGSFAALPLFLTWLQISWMIVLFGAEIAYANENKESYGFHPDYSRLSVSTKKFLALRIFHLLARRFSRGEKPLGLRGIARQLEMPVRLVDGLLTELIAVGLVVETTRGAGSDIGFQPGRTIEDMTIKTVLDAYEKSGATAIPEQQSEDAIRLSEFLGHISETAEKSAGNVRLIDV